jgi:hypothetical protein
MANGYRRALQSHPRPWCVSASQRLSLISLTCFSVNCVVRDHRHRLPTILGCGRARVAQAAGHSGLWLRGRAGWEWSHRYTSEHELLIKAKLSSFPGSSTTSRIVQAAIAVVLVLVTLGVSYYLNKQQALIVADVVYKRRKRRQARALSCDHVGPDVDEIKESVDGLVLVNLSGSLNLPVCATSPDHDAV